MHKPAISSPRSVPSCPSHVFEAVTDLLAELLLEDLRQFPTLADLPAVDTGNSEANTSRLSSGRRP